MIKHPELFFYVSAVICCLVLVSPYTYAEIIDPYDLAFDGLDSILPILLDQKPNNENGSFQEYKEFLMRENSNDDAAKLTTEELISRSNFLYELYEAISDDGYITKLIRLINPRADNDKLRQPPVLLEHGGLIDSSVYLIASSAQHHPEKYPRDESYGPPTSSDRSLGFYLSNLGFDVWLAETRGSSDKDNKRIRGKTTSSIIEGKNEAKNMTYEETLHEFVRQYDYWGFSQDDIIAHELKSHIDRVLEITKSEKLSLLTFSLSTPTGLAFLSQRLDYQEKIQGFITLAPIISGKGVNNAIDLSLRNLCPLIPTSLGSLLLTDIVLTPTIRSAVIDLARDKVFRYTFAKLLITSLFGPSPQYRTLLDLNSVGHTLRSLGFKEAKQLCQQLKANRLQKYDYGPIKNQILYNSLVPPEYDLSRIELKHWLVVSAANDKISTQDSLQALVDKVPIKPTVFVITGYNHVDLFAAVDNNIYVNKPIADFLISVSYGSQTQSSYSARFLDMSKMFPDMKFNSKSVEDLTKPIQDMPNRVNDIFSSLEKNMMNIFKGFDQSASNENGKTKVEPTNNSTNQST